MSHTTKINGTNHNINSGKVLRSGTSYSINSGKTLIGGTGNSINFVTLVTLKIIDSSGAASTGIGTKSFLVPKGRTWEDFIASEYNPIITYYAGESYSSQGPAFSSSFNRVYYFDESTNIQAAVTDSTTSVYAVPYLTIDTDTSNRYKFVVPSPV